MYFSALSEIVRLTMYDVKCDQITLFQHSCTGNRLNTEKSTLNYSWSMVLLCSIILLSLLSPNFRLSEHHKMNQ